MRRVARGRFIDHERPRGYHVDYSSAAENWTGQALPESPADLARLALGDLELYLARGTPERRDRFELAVSELVRRIETIPGGFSGWAMPEGPAAYRDELSEGWFSGRVHAECVAALVRAKTVLGHNEALACARAAFGGFETPVEEGGFVREIAEEGLESGLESALFIETYPTRGRSLCLGGHMRAMLTIHDYGRVVEPERAESLFTRALAGLEYTLDGFDTGSWSLADLDDRWRGARTASRALHKEHILHLKELARITGRSQLHQTAVRWGDYDARPLLVLRASVARVAFRIMNPGAPVEAVRGRRA
ncbi:MAG: hypothetical protein GF405_01945 [Candidatus Eisenbacteria bacterium]|nr:hypothetical protein [Candidatus Eisenbacteria bacterium]